jgi:hypothetical protein
MKYFSLLIAFVLISSVQAKFGDGELKEKTQEIKKDRIELRKDIKAGRASNAAEIKKDRIKLKDDIKERRDVMKKDIEAKRMEFKTKVAMIKDEKKKLTVEKLDTRFNEVNLKRTAQMTKHLDKMTEMLTKVTGDTASASSAIQTARDAVTAQAAKTYVITISTEANLKMDVGKVRSQLEADLKAVRELVNTARQAVRILLK